MLLISGKKFFQIISLCTFLFFLLSAGAANNNGTTLRLATTTSTKASGLLDILLPVFKQQSGYSVEVTATGSGKAIGLAASGKVDLIWVHSPKSEIIFIEKGYGILRHATMHNDFVIIGPKEDPADIASSNTVNEVLKKIAQGKHLFLSRGDDSGTHKKELSLWSSTKIDPYGRWYYEAGMGMGKLLLLAAEKKAYTLTDRGTWLAKKGDLNLKLLFKGDKQLLNHYSLIAVNHERFININSIAASSFIDFITSIKGQTLINNYRINGEQLFTPVNP